VLVVKRRQPLGAVLLVVLTTLALPACDRFDLRPSDESDNQFPRLIDEQEGRYGQVRFGSSEAEVRAAFGHPGGGDGFFPLEAESYRGPPSIKAPDGMKPTLLRY
jgi:hypothetical protein